MNDNKMINFMTENWQRLKTLILILMILPVYNLFVGDNTFMDDIGMLLMLVLMSYVALSIINIYFDTMNRKHVDTMAYLPKGVMFGVLHGIVIIIVTFVIGMILAVMNAPSILFKLLQHTALLSIMILSVASIYRTAINKSTFFESFRYAYKYISRNLLDVIKIVCLLFIPLYCLDLVIYNVIPVDRVSDFIHSFVFSILEVSVIIHTIQNSFISSPENSMKTRDWA